MTLIYMYVGHRVHNHLINTSNLHWNKITKKEFIHHDNTLYLAKTDGILIYITSSLAQLNRLTVCYITSYLHA